MRVLSEWHQILMPILSPCRPHIDGWGGLGTIIGWRNIIGEVTGKDPGHALYAAVRWDNQVCALCESLVHIQDGA